MKKGFTLIELLIVMVLVGVLVTVALPKYYSSMERGRVLEAVNNLRAASEAVNAAYIINGNAYPARSALQENGKLRGDFTKSVSFTAPAIIASSGQSISISLSRSGGDSYSLMAYNSSGDLRSIECYGTDAAKICENVGFEKDGSKYKMDFTK